MRNYLLLLIGTVLRVSKWLLWNHCSEGGWQEKNDQRPSSNPGPIHLIAELQPRAIGPSCKSFISHHLLFTALHLLTELPAQFLELLHIFSNVCTLTLPHVYFWCYFACSTDTTTVINWSHSNDAGATYIYSVYSQFRVLFMTVQCTLQSVQYWNGIFSCSIHVCDTPPFQCSNQVSDCSVHHANGTRNAEKTVLAPRNWLHCIVGHAVHCSSEDKK